MLLFGLDAASTQLLLWILGSVAAYGLVSNLLWLVHLLRARRGAPGGSPDGTLQVWRLAGVWLCEAGTVLFSVGIPYLALGGWPRRPLQGVISLPDLGLAGLGGLWTVNRWLEAAGTGVGLGLLALVVLLIALAAANRPALGLRLRFRPRPWWAIVIDVISLEIHWAFYRAGLVLLLGDVERGVMAGLGVIYLEWALSPFWRRGWGLAERAPAQWLQAALALVVSFVFLMTHNLWVCAAVHLLLELACWGLAREREGAAQGAQPA